MSGVPVDVVGYHIKPLNQLDAFSRLFSSLPNVDDDQLSRTLDVAHYFDLLVALFHVCLIYANGIDPVQNEAILTANSSDCSVKIRCDWERLIVHGDGHFCHWITPNVGKRLVFVFELDGCIYEFAADVVSEAPGAMKTSRIKSEPSKGW